MTAPNFELVIGTSTKTRYLTPNTINLFDNLDARTTLNFELRVPSSDNYRPACGAPIYFSNASSTVFAGTIDSYNETSFPMSSYLKFTCKCVDWTQTIGKRLVYASYTSGGYDADIITAINNSFFTGEGITTTDSYNSTGIIIPEVNFNYVPGNEAINTICGLTGRSWYIDNQKRLHYFTRDQNPAPFEINSTSNNWRSLTVRRTREKYRNREFLYDVYDLKNSYVEGFGGDGLTRVFSLTYPVYSVPTITLNAGAKTVGILNLDSSTAYNYYWNKESNLIVQNSTDTTVKSSDNLQVTYSGIYPIIARVDSEDEIESRKLIEGGSGIYESADTAPHIYTASAAILEGDSKLSRYGEMPEYVTFETDIGGLMSGQLIYINVTQNGLSDYYLIQSVSAIEKEKATMRYTVTAISGQDRGGWVSFFRSLTKIQSEKWSVPFSNNTVFSVKKYYGNIRFVDSGVSVTTSILVAAIVGTAQVGSAMVS